jgi:hypothetical protein
MLFWIHFLFLFFFNEESKAHNMLSLMLDPRFKNLKLISSLISQEQGIFIIQEYDMRSLFPMLLQCHQHLHLVVEFDITNQNIDANNNLNIFEMTMSYNEPMREFVNKELLSFKHYHVDNKEIKSPLEWWEKHESLFLIVGFLANRFLAFQSYK